MRVGIVGETGPLLPTEAAPEAGAGSGIGSAQSSGGVSFEGILLKTVEQADQADRVANAKIDALSRGASDDLHGTMIAAREADISIKLVGTLRNKLLDAFQEIWKTSV
jgi:flagellar hook-basal body complex protein FliE